MLEPTQLIIENLSHEIRPLNRSESRLKADKLGAYLFVNLQSTATLNQVKSMLTQGNLMPIQLNMPPQGVVSYDYSVL